MVESIKKVFELLRKDPVSSIRYILVITGIFVTFQNLFDCIVQNSHFYEYFLYVIVMGIITLSLVFIQHNSIICFVLALTGMLMVYDNNSPETISGGVIFFVFSKRIANNIFFSIFIYMATILLIAANHTFRGRTPADSINVIIGYFSIYLIDYILEGVQKTI